MVHFIGVGTLELPGAYGADLGTWTPHWMAWALTSAAPLGWAGKSTVPVGQQAVVQRLGSPKSAPCGAAAEAGLEP